MDEKLTYEKHTGEYSAEYKKECWDVAIGLQKVDNLEVSSYLKELSTAEIEGELTTEEIEKLLYQKYEKEEQHSEDEREADLVSTRIVRLLEAPGFVFSPVTLKHIHGVLFQDIYSFAGKFRNYNISKAEPVLAGRTVNYANYQMIEETYEYDFSEEKRKSYSGLSKEQILDRLANFSSSIWQVHPFGEGNTRTTAVFMEMYLNHMGFKVDNHLFAEHSKYFRNALVRSNYADYANNVFPDMSFLKAFYENLLFQGNHILLSRDTIVRQYL